MKTKDVPQDDENIFEGKFREVQYSVNEDGKYEQTLSVGWEPKNLVLNMEWDEIRERTEMARELVLAGKKSPLFYYMNKNLMDIKIVSEYSGFSRLRVWLDIKPKYFAKLSPKALKAYAKVFQLTDYEKIRTIE